MAKSKKFKIIVAVVCCVVILASIILTTTLLLTRKKFDIEPTIETLYNDHTSMTVVAPPTGLTIVNETSPTYYSNGTVLVKNSAGKFGIFSYSDNKLIIPTEHDDFDSGYELKPIKLSYQNHNLDTNNSFYYFDSNDEYIFKAGDDYSGRIKFYNDEGEVLEITCVDSTNGKTYSTIKQRKMSVKEKRKGIRVSTKDKFYNESIEIKDANIIAGYSNDNHKYEMWEITSISGTKYLNLYKVEGKSRKLIQTVNNPIGNDINLADNDTIIMPFILENGTPRLIVASNEMLTPNGQGTTLALYNQLSIYDIELNLVETVKLSNTEHLTYSFVIGNYLYAQYLTPASEDSYNCKLEDYSNEVEYFNLSTYRLNLKNGKYKEVDFDYLITGVNASFNDDTILLSAQEIDDKTIGKDTKNILINSKLKTKEIDYNIDSITKITNKRYLVQSGENVYLIEKDYDLVAYLGKYEVSFYTSESIVLRDGNRAFVTNLEGITIKEYDYNEIFNIYDDKYYLVKTTKEVDGVKYYEHYLERLGVREESPIYSKAETHETYEYNGKHYVTFDSNLIFDGISIITRVRLDGSLFIYEFYNFEGDLLLTLENFTTYNRQLTYNGYSDSENHILYISTATGGIGYYIVVDR